MVFGAFNVLTTRSNERHRTKHKQVLVSVVSWLNREVICGVQSNKCCDNLKKELKHEFSDRNTLLIR